MVRRARRRGLWLGLVVVVAGLALVWGRHSLLHWGLERLAQQHGVGLVLGPLHVDLLEGELWIESLRLQPSDGWRLEAQRLGIQWHMADLWQGQLTVLDLSAQQVRVQLPPQTTASTDSAALPPSLSFAPLPLTIQRLRLNDVQLQTPLQPQMTLSFSQILLEQFDALNPQQPFTLTAQWQAPFAAGQTQLQSRWDRLDQGQLKMSVQRLDLQQLGQWLPALAESQGRIKGEVSGEVVLRNGWQWFGELALEAADISYPAAGLQLDSGQLSSQASISQLASGWGWQGQAEVTVQGLNALKGEQAFSLTEGRWQGHGSLQSQLDHYQWLEGRLTAQGLGWRDDQQQWLLAEASVEDLGLDRLMGVSAGHLHANQVQWRALGESQPLLAWDTLYATQVALVEPSDVSSATLELAGVQATPRRGEQGIYWLAAEASTAVSDSPLRLKVDQLDIQANKVTLLDTTLPETPRLALTDLALRVEGVNSLSDGPIQIRGQGQGAYGRVHTRMQLPQPGQSGDLALYLQATSLDALTFSPYLQAKTGYAVSQGLVDVTLDITRDPQWQGSLAVLLDDVDVVALAEDEAASDLALGLPLRTALALLADRKGQIKLQIPISGAEDALNFGLQDVVRKGLLRSLQASLLASYSPLLGVSAVDKAGRLAQKWWQALELQAVDFLPGSSVLTQESEVYLQQLLQQLTVKPRLAIHVCGQAGQQDEAALQNLAQLRQSTTEPVTKVSRDQLQRLVYARADGVKRWLVSRDEALLDRVSLCQRPVEPDLLPQAVIRVR